MARRSIRRRHARAVVLWTGAAFALIQLALGLAVDNALPQVRDPEFAHREELLQQRIAQEPGQPLVVAVGSSRVMNGIDGQTATQTLQNGVQVFNFGIPLSGPFLEEIWFERLLADGAKPDLLLIEVFPAFFNERQSRDQNQLDGARLRAGELSRVRPTLHSLAGPIRRWTTGRALPSYRHQAELRWLLQIDRQRDGKDVPEDLRTVDAFGWQPRGYSAEECERLKRLAHKQYDDCYRDFKLSKAQASQLDELLSRCRKKGIQAALILTPEGSEFRKLYTPQMNTAIDSMLAGLRAKYGVAVIDAREWLDDSHFYDMHHLLYSGAREFSRRLASEGLAPLLPKNRAIAGLIP